MCAGFKAGSGDAHHLLNRTRSDVLYLEVGDRSPGDSAAYPDDDMQAALGRMHATEKRLHRRSESRAVHAHHLVERVRPGDAVLADVPFPAGEVRELLRLAQLQLQRPQVGLAVRDPANLRRRPRRNHPAGGKDLYAHAMRLALCAFFLMLAPLCAGAQAVSREDASAVRRVIEAQIDAFRKDDGVRAFSYATPGIRMTFGTAENFMEMVRTQYAVVYRPRSVEFDAPAFAGPDDIVQPVRLTDGEGRAWLALYPMQRGSDGVWRTNGCQLRRIGQET